MYPTLINLRSECGIASTDAEADTYSLSFDPLSFERFFSKIDKISSDKFDLKVNNRPGYYSGKCGIFFSTSRKLAFRDYLGSYLRINAFPNSYYEITSLFIGMRENLVNV